VVAFSAWQPCSVVLRFKDRVSVHAPAIGARHWLGAFLYGVGNDTVTLTVVCVIWFVLGAMIAGFLGLLFSVVLDIRGRSNR
jgi:hypothetical protein